MSWESTPRSPPLGSSKGMSSSTLPSSFAAKQRSTPSTADQLTQEDARAVPLQQLTTRPVADTARDGKRSAFERIVGLAVVEVALQARADAEPVLRRDR